MEKQSNKAGRLRRVATIALNALIFAMVAYAWSIMFFVLDESGRLSTAGFGSLKYFTVLSNLLMGCAALVWVIALLREKTPHWALVLKFAGTVSVTLTLLTVLVFLGPLFGYETMFLGANLFMHLIVPLAAIADFVLLCREGQVSKRDAVWAASPMFLYGTWYVANNLINGIGEWPNTNDFYGFFTWGYAVAALIAVIMAVGTWGLARALRRLRLRLSKEQTAQ